MKRRSVPSRGGIPDREGVQQAPPRDGPSQDPNQIGYGKILCYACGVPTRDHPVGRCDYYLNGVNTKEGITAASGHRGKNIK